MVRNMLKRALPEEFLQKIKNKKFPLGGLFSDLEFFGKISNYRFFPFGLEWSEICWNVLSWKNLYKKTKIEKIPKGDFKKIKLKELILDWNFYCGKPLLFCIHIFKIMHKSWFVNFHVYCHFSRVSGKLAMGGFLEGELGKTGPPPIVSLPLTLLKWQ